MFQRVGWIALLAGMWAESGASSDLHEQIRAIARQAQGRVAVACSLPGVSLDCNLNVHAHPPMQSVFKLPLAMTVLHLAEEGKFALNQLMCLRRQTALRCGPSVRCRRSYPQGEVDVPIEELTRLAVVESDNVASELLLKLVGGPTAVNDYVGSLRVKGFHLRDGERRSHQDPALPYRNWFEPAGAVRILRLLADQSPLNPAYTNLLLGWMRQTPSGANRIPGRLPSGTVAMQKPGSSATEDGRTAAWNDIGLIDLPDGRKLAIAVFITSSTVDEQIRDP